MKTLPTIAFATATCLVAYGSAATIATTQANSSLTCQTALEDSDFAETDASEDAAVCCYVLTERTWYRSHGVHLNRFYVRLDDDQIYLTKECMAESGGNGGGDGNNGGGGNSPGN